MFRIPLFVGLAATVAVTVLTGLATPSFAETVYVDVPEPVFLVVPPPECVTVYPQAVSEDIPPQFWTLRVCVRPV